MTCPCKSRESLAPCKQAVLWAFCLIERQHGCKRTAGDCWRHLGAALWQCTTVRVLALAACVGLVAFLASCRAVPAKPRPAVTPPPNAAPVVAGQLSKDESIEADADAIDEEVAGTPQAPAVNAATNRQRKALKDWPAADVAKLVADYEATIASYKAAAESDKKTHEEDSKLIAKLRKDLAAALDYVDRILRIGLTGLGAIIMAGSVAAFFMLGQLTAIFPNLGPRIIGGIAAFGAMLFASGIAYSWAAKNQGIVGCVLGASALAALIYWHSNRIHSKAA